MSGWAAGQARVGLLGIKVLTAGSGCLVGMMWCEYVLGYRPRTRGGGVG